MAHVKRHDYHILNPSIWPFLGALGGFIMLGGSVLYFHDKGPWIALMGLALVLYVMYSWWAEVVTEADAGDHTPVVMIGLRYGMILFIISEVMFFVAWFWTFFKNALYPMTEGYPAVDGVWPPVGIETFDPWHLPVINTLILLCSGAAATWAHHAIAHENNRKDLVRGLVLAIALGIMFTVFQAFEYSEAAFGFAGNIYGSTFFMATGFHGFHVIIGTIFLSVCLIRALNGHFTPKNHLGFEAAAWYWHFVDVVWLFLFAAIYVWGG
ncbi:MAG: cytochrome c oxidase subunit 3 [Alphaproteobacteria bacterium]|nr:cytochrome c oxidase subunit 3 [Alphaproteobacteria bacterium]